MDDICQLLHELLSELDISVHDPLVNKEVQTVKKCIQDAIANIHEIKKDRTDYSQNVVKTNCIYKIFAPYIMYLTLLGANVSIPHSRDFEYNFVTAILQKHLESIINHNG